jgi:hypothetical protein
MHDSAINTDVKKRRFALLVPAGYGERLGFNTSRTNASS